jgi:hypothetical protein
MNAHLAKPIPSGLVYYDADGLLTTLSLMRPEYPPHSAGICEEFRATT